MEIKGTRGSGVALKATELQRAHDRKLEQLQVVIYASLDYTTVLSPKR